MYNERQAYLGYDPFGTLSTCQWFDPWDDPCFEPCLEECEEPCPDPCFDPCEEEGCFWHWPCFESCC